MGSQSICGLRRYKTTVKILFSYAVLGMFVISLYYSVLVILPSNPEEAAPIAASSDYAATERGTPTKELHDEYGQGLGEIEITNAQIRGQPFYFTSSDVENITFELKDAKFIRTEKPANTTRAWGAGTGYRSSNVTIIMNDTVKWTFNSTPAGYILGYQPYLLPFMVRACYLNGTKLVLTNNNTDHGFTFMNETTGFFYNFTTEFEEIITTNGSSYGELLMIYEYEAYIPISKWQVFSTLDKDEYLVNSTQEFTRQFYYNMSVSASQGINYDMAVRINITLPDPTKITDAVIDDVDGKPITDTVAYYSHQNEHSFWINLTSEHVMNARFKGKFKVEFLDIVNYSWCEDRLVQGIGTRERDYKLTITEGPDSLLLTQFWINETRIFYPDIAQLNNVTSALGRGIQIINMNKTVNSSLDDMDDDDSGLPEEKKPKYQDGINFVGFDPFNRYYIGKGEVDVITLKYRAYRVLSFVVTDKIKTPLPNYRVNIRIGNASYGTRISLNDSMPYPTKIADQNGQIIVRNVPLANYTLEILDPDGIFVEYNNASSEFALSFVVTHLTHIPVVAMVFTAISAAFILLGVAIYKKSSKQP